MPPATDTDFPPLDQLIWRALSGPQSPLAEGGALARRYLPAIAPFAALAEESEAAFAALHALMAPAERAALFTPHSLTVPPWFEVERRAPVDQMIWDSGSPAPEMAFETLGPDDVPDMLALVRATEPGPFATRTVEFGGYLGVRRQGRLVAMTGERMRIQGYSEVSAVCVHPDCRGEGLAAALVRAVPRGILDRGEVPILHVFSANAPAIALYRKLGYRLRRQMQLTALRRE
jgi:Predicted acetyltransferase